MKRVLWGVIAIAALPVTSNDVTAATYTIYNEWSCGGSVVSQGEFGATEARRSCGAYTVPGFNDDFGRLVGDNTRIEGTYNTTVRHAAPVPAGRSTLGGQQITVTDASPGITPNPNRFLLEGSTADAEPDSTTGAESGVFTSVGRSGLAGDFGQKKVIEFEGNFFATPAEFQDFTPGNQMTTTADARGALQTTYEFEPSSEFLNPESIQPIFIADTNPSNPADFVPLVGVPAGLGTASPIGALEEVNGDVYIIRADGTREKGSVGAPIYSGDIVETNADGAANMVFIDETEFAIDENARITIDDYVFDPETETGSQNFSVLRGIFVFTSDLIGRDKPDDVEVDVPQGSLGIRGDAGQYTGADLINVAESLGAEPEEIVNPGIVIETASPVSVSTFVEVPEEQFLFEFDYVFFGDEGIVDIILGDFTLFSLDAQDAPAGVVQSIGVEFDWTAHVSELTIQMDGPAGLEFLFFNAMFNGQNILENNLWSNGGKGPAEFVFVTTDVVYDALTQNGGVSEIPVPAALPLFLAGLTGLGFVKRKHRV